MLHCYQENPTEPDINHFGCNIVELNYVSHVVVVKYCLTHTGFVFTGIPTIIVILCCKMTVDWLVEFLAAEWNAETKFSAVYTR